jgi:hypothetical protein
MKKELLASEIARLKSEGYFVYEVVDIEPIRYAWRHRNGPSQRDVLDRQPYRRSEAQAWVDCRDYTMGYYDDAPEPDWLDR